jgi:hypothetical protein
MVPDDKDYEIETLRRLFAVAHEKSKEPSRWKKVFIWLCGEKAVKSTRKRENEAA